MMDCKTVNTAFRTVKAPILFLIAPLISVIFFLNARTVFADTYKCEKAGTVSYSDKPCSANAQPMLLPEPKAPAQKNDQRSISVQQKYHQISTRLETDRKQRAATRKIATLKVGIEQTEHEREAALNAIRKLIEAIDYESDDFDDKVLAEAQEKELNARIKATEQSFKQKLDKLRAEIEILQLQISTRKSTQ